MTKRLGPDLKELVLNGGLCGSPYFFQVFFRKPNRQVTAHPFARYADTLGVARAAAKQITIEWDYAMIKKTEKLVITFYTTTDAMAMERICKEKNADGRLIPVPRAISAGCGLAWCANLDSEAALTALMQESGIPPQGFHRCLV